MLRGARDRPAVVRLPDGLRNMVRSQQLRRPAQPNYAVIRGIADPALSNVPFGDFRTATLDLSRYIQTFI
jgi:hypothetical protein